MAEVIPFRGILYNALKVSGGDIVAPPYDIITPELRRALYEKSPYNIVRIDAGEEQAGDGEAEDKYTRASRFLEQWQRDEVLIRSEKPSFYAYEMEYESSEGKKRLRGFFGLVKLVELGSGVYPHEETHSKPKVDRLNLMKACMANTSPIFSLYNSPGRRASAVVGAIAGTCPYLTAKDLQGDTHRIWIIERSEDIDVIRKDLSGRAIFIADGHHRYETALEYRRMTGQSPDEGDPRNYVLMFLANMADDGLTILPTHRIIKHPGGDILGMISGFFDVEKVPADRDLTAAMRGNTGTFGLFLKGDADRYLLRLKGSGPKTLPTALQGLDVAILHEFILKDLLKVSDVVYEMDAAVAEEMVGAGGYDAVFFLNPTRVEDVERVALSSLRMPPKSTYFYPKVLTGFVINSLKNSI